jgi:hypothetical protein
MTQVKYVVADRATGEIEMHGTCFDVDLDAVPVQAHQVKLVGDAHPATHYHDEVLGLQPYTAAQQAAKVQRVPHSRWDNRAMAWVDARPLEALRADRWAQIKGARAAAMDAPIDTAFGVFDADPASRSALVEALALSGSGRALVRWTTADNQVVPLSLEELASVALQIAQRTEQCHTHAQQLRVRIEQAATAGELETIRW